MPIFYYSGQVHIGGPFTAYWAKGESLGPDIFFKKINLGSQILMRPYNVTRRDHEVIDFTRYRVKSSSKLTNLIKIDRIEGYNGK